MGLNEEEEEAEEAQPNFQCRTHFFLLIGPQLKKITNMELLKIIKLTEWCISKTWQNGKPILSGKLSLIRIE